MYKKCKYLKYFNNVFTCFYRHEENVGLYGQPACPKDSGTDHKCNGKCWELKKEN